MQFQPERSQNEDARLTILDGRSSPHRGIGKSIAGAIALLAWDAGIGGTFITSIIICPIWFLVSVLKNAIQLPGWGIALIRIAIPPLTLCLVLANNSFQRKIAEENAPRIIAACEQFHATNGKYPKTLDDLVPQYLSSVPCAKYCLMYGEFMYWNMENHPMLVWHVVPPFGRKIYTFEDRRWGYID
jgi:hypothetical protein